MTHVIPNGLEKINSMRDWSVGGSGFAAASPTLPIAGSGTFSTGWFDKAFLGYFRCSRKQIVQTELLQISSGIVSSGMTKAKFLHLALRNRNSKWQEIYSSSDEKNDSS